MPTLTFKRGRDAWANEQYPNARSGAKKYPLARAGTGVQSFVYVQLPLSGIEGRVITSATLSVPVRGTASAQNVLVAAIAGSWTAARMTWNKGRPSVRAGEVTQAITAKVDGERLEVPITALVQAVADGARDFGFRVTCSDQVRFYGFDSGAESWVLTVEVSDAPEQPDALAPQAGVVGLPKPTLTWVLGDTGLEDTQQTGFEVQVDAAADGVTPDWTSGVVVSTLPQLDLAATTFPALVDGAATQWRVRVQDDGIWSEWSDWAAFTYQAKPGLTVASPTGGSLYDPSPVVQFSTADASVLAAYRVQVFPDADLTNVLYDSGIVEHDASLVTHQIPLRNRRGQRVFRDDRTYRLRLIGYDDPDRLASPGDPRYTSVDLTVAFDDDVNPPVTSLTATQQGQTPLVRLTFARSAAPDAWVFIRNGKVIARVDHADATSEFGPIIVGQPGTWSWADRTAPAGVPLEYRVKAVTDGGSGLRQSSDGGRSAGVQTDVRGVWLIRSNGDAVVLDGDGIGGFEMNDRRASYRPPHVGYDVDIITAFEGVTGTYSGVFVDGADVDLDHAAVLAAIKDEPAEPVRLVWASQSVPVLLRNLVPGLPTERWKRSHPENYVTFEFFQCDDFDHRV